MKRGRKSVAELLIGSPVVGYPDAPYNLTDAEAEEWRAIVASMQPGYFARSHYPLLTQLCRHVVISNRVAMLIEQCCKKRTFDRAELASLLAMQNAETQALIRLCRQLRLSHQAIMRLESRKTRPAPAIEVPWHRDK